MVGPSLSRLGASAERVCPRTLALTPVRCSPSQMEDSLLLLRFNCPDKSCDYIAGGWTDLRQHASHRHGAELWCVRQHLLAFCWARLSDGPLPSCASFSVMSASSSRRFSRTSRSSTRRLSCRTTCRRACLPGASRRRCHAAWRSRPRWASTQCKGSLARLATSDNIETDSKPSSARPQVPVLPLVLLRRRGPSQAHEGAPRGLLCLQALGRQGLVSRKARSVNDRVARES